MLVPYSWLKEYVPELELPAERLEEKLTLAGVEVEEVSNFNPGVEGVVVGRIEKIEPHPEADRLQLTSVRVGEKDEPKNIVCGAFNIKEGDCVPVALPGARLPEWGEIKKTTIRNVTSQGMLCSPAELGLELVQEEEGILLLDTSWKPGTSLVEALELDDPVITLELTPNRSDCLGMLGVAYEVSALTGCAVKLPPEEPAEVAENVEDYARVEIKDEELCARYTARVIRNSRITCSPLWMQLRLLKAGVRPINNIVDITNYVMWEVGQPLHAFDYSLVKEGTIIVRRANPGEKLVTIDGEERQLTESNLVIADPGGPVALAGVMGGQDTEISENTSEILLEAAFFNPASIRRTARNMNMISEASLRFEKGVNPEGVMQGQNRASRLMAELAGGEVLSGVVDCYPQPEEPRRVRLGASRMEKLLGTSVPAKEVESVLSRLGFGIAPSGDGDSWEVEVPLRRPDVAIEEDVVEEVARLYGYDRIPTRLPEGALVDARETVEERINELIRDTMTASGMYECITYSFINPQQLNRLNLPEEHQWRNCVPLQNPITEDQGIMRTTLLPGLLETVKYNRQLGAGNQLLFELGSVFIPNQLPLQELPREVTCLGLAGTGSIPEKSWYEKAGKVDFFYLKGIVENLWDRLAVENYSFEQARYPFLHPNRAAALKVNGEEVGYLGQLHPDVAREYQLKSEVIVGEIDVSKVEKAASLFKYFQSLPRYPASLRDLAVLVPRELPAAEVEKCIRETGGKLLEEVSLFDLYEGDPVPQGYRSLAYSVVYRSPEKTLTDEEVGELHQKVIDELYRRLGVAVRQ